MSDWSRSVRSTDHTFKVRDTPQQLWKVNDRKAHKKGLCKSVYWVQEKKNTKEDVMPSEARKTWKRGTMYKGEWNRNKKHGYGVQVWANGNKYEGDWKNGARHGHGVLWIKQRRTGQLRKVYAGNWKKGFKDGLGVQYYSNGDRYEGNWVHSMRHGQGTQFYQNQDVYVGEWSEDRPSGFGTLTKANQDIYEGKWLNGKREGPGIHYFKSKEKIYDGEWVNDIPKCGVYCAASEFFQDEPPPGEPIQRSMRQGYVPRIPRLRLAAPDSVLSQRIEEIQRQRQAVRTMPFVELEKFFTPDRLDDLRQVFRAHDTKDDGHIRASSLQDLLMEKFTVTDIQVAQILLDLNKAASDTLNFREFVKAVHLMAAAQQTAEAPVPDISRSLQRPSEDSPAQVDAPSQTNVMF